MYIYTCTLVIFIPEVASLSMFSAAFINCSFKAVFSKSSLSWHILHKIDLKSKKFECHDEDCCSIRSNKKLCHKIHTLYREIYNYGQLLLNKIKTVCISFWNFVNKISHIINHFERSSSKS